MDEKRSDNYSQHDSFWDLESVTPTRHTRRPIRPSHTEPHEIELPPTDGGATVKEGERIPPSGTVIKRYVSPHFEPKEGANTPELQYTPQLSLIHSVKIYRWNAPYKYYEGFVRSAQAYRDYSSSQCEPVEFFSYMPQYAQMTGRQLSYYFYLRGQLRDGIYPDIEYTYLLLFIYETINLAPITTFEYAVDILSRLWINYRKTYTRLDSQLSEWIFDLCLMGNIRPPYQIIGDVIGSLPATASLREFFVDAGADAQVFASVLMKYCSNYNYRKSKFATAENLTLYETHMNGVLSYVLSKSSDRARPFDFCGLKLQDSKTTRDTFMGALCSAEMKKRIEIEYCSFSHSHELRFTVTDLLKFAENRIRSYIGVKSRLSFGALSMPLRALADEYFNEKLPRSSGSLKNGEEDSQYEHLYEPKESSLTFDAARAIEESSWLVTERLIETFAEDLSEDASVDETSYLALEIIDSDSNPVSLCADDEPFVMFVNGCKDFELSFLTAALEGDFLTQRKIAEEQMMMLHMLADLVNTQAFESIGDIVLVDDSGYFVVLDEYADSLREALLSRKG